MKLAFESEKDDYKKIIEAIELTDEDHEWKDKSQFFNAWSFGLQEEDCEFTISSSL